MENPCESPKTTASTTPDDDIAERSLPPWLRSNRWLIYLLPFFVFMLVQTLEPPPTDIADGSEIGWMLLGITYEHYPLVYSAKIALTLAAMLAVLPGYRTHPFRISPWAPAVGVVGVVAWIGLCHLGLEARLFAALGFDGFFSSGERPGYNPLVHLADSPAWAWGFLGIRFFGLAVVVAVIEEFFLRGFVLRFVVAQDWWKVPFGTVTPLVVVLGTAIPMAMHPGELLASLVWFSMITWLMMRTRNIWDCVVAHGVTNLLLGIYVVKFDQWQLM